MTVRTAGGLEALDQLREAHVASLNTGDVDAWVSCFATDAVQMPPNVPANVGRESIRTWARALLADFRADFSLAPEEVEKVGADCVYERGRYAITLTPRAGGAARQDAGKYLTLYRRLADGAWVMARDIWNSDSAPPGPAEGTTAPAAGGAS
jgi:uncharacterized protein (TIGR02246 family)